MIEPWPTGSKPRCSASTATVGSSTLGGGTPTGHLDPAAAVGHPEPRVFEPAVELRGAGAPILRRRRLGQPASSPPGAGRSAAARPRSSATCSASGSSASPESPEPHHGHSPVEVITSSHPQGNTLETGDRRIAGMLRPGSWTRPAGGSPVRVVVGEPGSRPRFVVERWRAERGVKSLFGGSKHAGRSATRCESCSLVRSTTGEPSRSCHGEGHVRRVVFRRCAWSGPSGVRGAARAHGLVRNRRDPSAQPRQQRPTGISQW